MAVMQCSDEGIWQTKSIVLYELKPALVYHVMSVDPSHLDQAIVEGYYALLRAL